MKKLYFIFFVFSVFSVSEASAQNILEFCEADGTIIPTGTSLTLTDVDEDIFGDKIINSGVYVKTTSGYDENCRMTAEVTEMEGGASLQCCFPDQCKMFPAVGTYDCGTGTVKGEKVADLMTELMIGEAESASCTVKFTLTDEFDQGSSTITLHFVYGQSGIDAANNANSQQPGQSNSIFTLSGQKVSAPVKGQIYIISGRKVRY